MCWLMFLCPLPQELELSPCLPGSRLVAALRHSCVGSLAPCALLISKLHCPCTCARLCCCRWVGRHCWPGLMEMDTLINEDRYVCIPACALP